MTTREALDIILDLAVENFCNVNDHPKEYKKQCDALKKVENFIMNNHPEDMD